MLGVLLMNFVGWTFFEIEFAGLTWLVVFHVKGDS